jgi:hypothetical protein
VLYLHLAVDRRYEDLTCFPWMDQNEPTGSSAAMDRPRKTALDGDDPSMANITPGLEISSSIAGCIEVTVDMTTDMD